MLSGQKRATAGLLLVYAKDGEALEHVGELLALLDDDGHALAAIEVTDVHVRRFADVTWEFAAAEGEGDEDLEHWRTGHQGNWAAQATPVDDDTQVVCLRFVVRCRTGPGG